MPGCLVLLLAYLVAPTASSNVIRLELERIEITETRESTGGNRLLNSAGAVQLGSVTNYNNAQYSTTLYVGSKFQAMNLIIDTGSSLTWL